VLVEDVLPLVPESVLATERTVAGKRRVSLLAQAILRKDRALAEAIVKAIAELLESTVKVWVVISPSMITTTPLPSTSILLSLNDLWCI